jgi:hypothetical protein
MHCDDLLDIEKQYRVAVHTYCDAVDQLDSSRDFDGAWRQIESARANAERARSALLGHQLKHLCVALHAGSNHKAIPETVPDPGINEFVLGDQGQPGG